MLLISYYPLLSLQPPLLFFILFFPQLFYVPLFNCLICHLFCLCTVRIKPGSTSPVEYHSDSDAESGTESGSASLSAQSLDAG